MLLNLFRADNIWKHNYDEGVLKQDTNWQTRTNIFSPLQNCLQRVTLHSISSSSKLCLQTVVEEVGVGGNCTTGLFVVMTLVALSLLTQSS